jgi:ArsR family transcriptional regulator
MIVNVFGCDRSHRVRRSRMGRTVTPPGVTPPTEAGCCNSVTGAPLGVEDAERLALRFAAVADPVRLRLLSLVAQAGEVCSCDLTEPLERSQPTISHHTKVLADAGLLVGEKRGRWVWWRVAPDALAELRETLR